MITSRGDDMEDNDSFDVAIVGYGPVGAALAILLGQRGRRVVVLERHLEPYPLPRAVHYDHEAARILQSCGMAEECLRIAQPVEVYEFQNAERRPLIRFGRFGDGPSGWPQSSMFSQPELEAALFARVKEVTAVEVRRGWPVTGIEEDADAVVVHTERGPVRAGYVVACDGANSTVRSLVGIPTVDRGFFYDWLVVDVIFDQPRVFDPPNVQICDPARPTTVVSGGPGRRRWEFMALPGESVAELDDEATAWRLLEPFDAHPGNARLERHAVYRFQARWAAEWRRGRILLAGDAAHQTPPFAGQGLCAGFRDAANLTWKLDLVLGDLAPEALLDTYAMERSPHAQAVIDLAIDMGKMICVADPAEAAARDEAFFATYDGSLTEIPPFPAITEGIVLPGTPAAGELFLQADVEVDGTRGRFDDVVGAGWRLVTIAEPTLDDEIARWFAAIGGRVVTMGCGSSPVRDVDGAYGKWFADHGVVAALQRPDFALFGTATESARIPTVLHALRDSLRSARRSA
jgi:2-polyprenyl-6-methoxyphenol hydroxylase-like FAD-dependent oxidoreductase